MGGKLIVNADDFGLCHSVNTAIINGFLAGNISSTTIMAKSVGMMALCLIEPVKSKEPLTASQAPMGEIARAIPRKICVKSVNLLVKE